MIYSVSLTLYDIHGIKYPVSNPIKSATEEDSVLNDSPAKKNAKSSETGEFWNIDFSRWIFKLFKMTTFFSFVTYYSTNLTEWFERRDVQYGIYIKYYTYMDIYMIHIYQISMHVYMKNS